ncbi:GNAT family protein [Limibacter armeniacum]|uniref:GNAT family N-acetyltransferase n=1 Tax=Limibacter armeniacum TaxID=466084 RepID=UPI002FE61991
MRKLTQATYDFIFAHFTDIQLMTFLGIPNTTELTKEKKKYEGGLSTHNRSFLNFLLIDKSTDKVIGSCGFHTWYIDHNRAEIGYALSDESAKNKGYMSEALQQIIAYGFEKMELHRIEAFVGPENAPSVKLVEKHGFTKEGHLKEHYLKNGKFEDSLVYALLKKDFNQ